jgi:hypothetical protein
LNDKHTFQKSTENIGLLWFNNEKYLFWYIFESFEENNLLVNVNKNKIVCVGGQDGGLLMFPKPSGNQLPQKRKSRGPQKAPTGTHNQREASPL